MDTTGRVHTPVNDAVRHSRNSLFPSPLTRTFQLQSRSKAMHSRKHIRLSGFDYSQPGVYYISINAWQGLPLFGSQFGLHVVPSQLGELVDALWRELPRHAAGLRLDVFRIMPSHLHGIVVLRGSQGPPQREAFGHPTRNTIPTIVRGFKGAVTREWRRLHGDAPVEVWHGRYLERVIRSREELAAMRCFVRLNPLWHRLSDRDPW